MLFAWRRVLRDSGDRMMKHIYYCERCGTMIQVEADPEDQPPSEIVCPQCEYPHAVRAFAAPQQSGCCGPAPQGGGSGG